MSAGLDADSAQRGDPTPCVVLREKLRPPEVGGLVRDRLTAPLLTGAGTLAGLVVAPAGCGKTTLLSHVAAAAAEPVGWYSATADDATETRFVAHVAAALGDVLPVDHADSIADLLAALDTWTGPGAMLILDDLHEIAGSAAERACERLITLRPRRLQVLCGSRRIPDVNVPRLRVGGALCEIGGDELAFRAWEVEELFASGYRTPLRPEAAAALTRSTGGWAAGLQLFHLATAGRSGIERHQAVAHLGGRSPFVRSYLTRNVLAELAQDRREFLVRTATLGRLSGEACDALLGASGSHRILRELASAQLFTLTHVADDGAEYFRYHEVLRAHLELALVEEYGVAEARRWYHRSAEVLEALGECDWAAKAYAKAGDWSAVSRLVQGAGGRPVDAAAVGDLGHGAWRDDPWLALADARRLVRDGALARAVDVYRHAATLYDEPSFRQMCRDESDVVAMWLPGRRGEAVPTTPHWSTCLREALRRAPAAGAAAGGAPDDARGRLARGVAAACRGEIDCARDILAEVRREESAHPLVTIGANLTLIALDYVTGNAPLPLAHLGVLAAMAEAEGLPWVARSCRGLEQIALIAAHGALWRFDGCDDMVRDADRRGDAWGAALLAVAFALARHRAGQDAGAEFGAAAARFDVLGAPILQQWCLRRERLAAEGADTGATKPAAVTITCLGDYRLAVDGHAVALNSLRPQARRVLQILSLSPGRDHHREYLEDLLWPGVDHAVAGHRLQVAVSSARGAVAGHGVSIDRRGQCYRLRLPDGATVDVCEFGRAVAAADSASARGDVAGRIAARREALRCYAGDLLPDLDGVEQVCEERGRLRRRAAAVAAALASDRRMLGDHEEALDAARESVRLDPCQEAAWSVLAEVHTELGDLSTAEYLRRELLRVQAELIA